MPDTRGSSLSSISSRSTWPCWRVVRQPVVEALDADLGGRLLLAADVDAPTPGRRRRAPSPARARGWPASTHAATSARDLRAHLLRDRLAVDDLAAMRGAQAIARSRRTRAAPAQQVPASVIAQSAGEHQVRDAVVGRRRPAARCPPRRRVWPIAHARLTSANAKPWATPSAVGAVAQQRHRRRVEQCRSAGRRTTISTPSAQGGAPATASASIISAAAGDADDARRRAGRGGRRAARSSGADRPPRARRRRGTRQRSPPRRRRARRAAAGRARRASRTAGPGRVVSHMPAATRPSRSEESSVAQRASRPPAAAAVIRSAKTIRPRPDDARRPPNTGSGPERRRRPRRARARTARRRPRRRSRCRCICAAALARRGADQPAERARPRRRPADALHEARRRRARGCCRAKANAMLATTISPRPISTVGAHADARAPASRRAARRRTCPAG